MLGAIAGDVIGSVHEYIGTKTTEFPLFVHRSDFTDDSVLTVAVAEALLDGLPYDLTVQRYARAYPGRGYGGRFREWITQDPPRPYGSWGNGSAMRVSPIGFAAEDLDAAIVEARRTAEITHDHPEGIRGAEATAAAVFLARTGVARDELRRVITERFGYALDFTIDDIRADYSFKESCAQTVPQAIVAFLDSSDFEHAIRLAISLGGDADTLACITGGIADAHYGGVPTEIAEETRKRLDPELLAVVRRFEERFLRSRGSR
ncbi:MAG: ADP-ribosylglycohydrolase family protein [Planctomycetes bacterium]|nr:ADP-ribosylglycohydrolase family protein [Planctomycetota bacterium]